MFKLNLIDMKIKLFTAALFFVSSCYFVSAQSKSTKKADEYFNKYEYTTAASEYLKLIKSNKADNYVYKKLGDIYFLMYKDDEAVKWYKEAVESPQDAETHFRYAQALRTNGNQDEFKKQMDLFATKAPNDPRAVAYKNKPNYLPELEKKVTPVVVSPVATNTPNADFGALIYQDKVYFASTRKGRKNSRINKMTGEPFTKIFVADFTKGKFSNAQEVVDLNSRLNDGLVCFNKDGDIAYFSSSAENINNLVVRNKRYKGNDVNKHQLFSAKKDKYGYWTEYQVVSFCDKDFTYTNPTLSPDGKTMYFASNFTGGYGGLDIWRVNLNSDGSFSEPQNLGPAINTVYDENYPFIKEDNQTLFFASKGHDGFGGFDIFEIDTKNSGTKPSNLGVPFNTEKDDFAYSFYSQNGMGFLSSNRDGNIDIYSIQESNQEHLLATLTETISGEPIKNAKIQIIDGKDKVLKTLTTDEVGQISYMILADTKYKLKFENTDYESFVSETQTATKGNKKLSYSIKKNMPVPKPEPIVFKPNNIQYEFNKFDLTSQSIDELDKIAIALNTTSDLKLEIVAHTDARGSEAYNLKLSKKRAKSAYDYLISKGVEASKLTMNGMGESQLLVDCGENCSDEDHAKNRRSEFKVTNADGQVIALNL